MSDALTYPHMVTQPGGGGGPQFPTNGVVFINYLDIVNANPTPGKITRSINPSRCLRFDNHGPAPFRIQCSRQDAAMTTPFDFMLDGHCCETIELPVMVDTVTFLYLNWPGVDPQTQANNQYYGTYGFFNPEEAAAGGGQLPTSWGFVHVLCSDMPFHDTPSWRNRPIPFQIDTSHVPWGIQTAARLDILSSGTALAVPNAGYIYTADMDLSKYRIIDLLVTANITAAQSISIVFWEKDGQGTYYAGLNLTTTNTGAGVQTRVTVGPGAGAPQGANVAAGFSNLIDLGSLMRIGFFGNGGAQTIVYYEVRGKT